MDKRVVALIIWLCICICLFVWFKVRKRLGRYGAIGLGVVMLCLFLLGSNLINLNILPRETQEKLNKVTEVCGDTYIKASGKDIFVKVNGRWLDLSEVSIIGELLTDDVVITYEGESIYIGRSGVVNTIRVLESVGLISAK